METLKSALNNFDHNVSRSTFGRVFRLAGSGHVRYLPTIFWSVMPNAFAIQPEERKDARFFTEIGAGLTTFFTMAYVIAVNVSVRITCLRDVAKDRGLCRLSDWWDMHL